MANLPKVYIDNNDKIYYTDRLTFDNLGSASSQLSAGLADVAETPGQSTWLINKVQFGAHIFTDIDGSLDGSPYGSTLLGVLPYGEVGIFDGVDDYQNVRGWPLLGTWKSWAIPKLTTGAGVIEPYLYPMSRTSVSGTYTPKSPLALNRMQEIKYNLDNVGNVDVYGSMWMFISARRGE